ncbi:MAG: hypothetical protein JW882_06265 [Deltaproteobacteria bacterium]|nr:hypothetical protein [Deltaproteobacteria bacterium]
MGNELNLMAEMINERGGIDIKGDKYNLEIVIEDCKSTLDGATAAATSIASKGIKYAVGPAAFFSRGTAPITNRDQIIDVLGYNNMMPEEIGPAQPYTFAGLGGSPARTLSGIYFLKEKFPQVKKVCMVSPVGGINPYLEAHMRKHLTENGFSIVGEWVKFADDATEWSSYAAKIKANKEADAVFWMNCISFHVGNMVKSLRELGDDRWVFAWSNAPGVDVMKIVGKDNARKVVTQAFTPLADDNPADLNEITRRSQAKYGKDVPLYFETANPISVLVEVLKKAQSIDTNVVKATWESMDGQTVNSLFGPAYISGTQTYGGLKGHGLGHAHPHQILDNATVTNGGWYDSGPLP